MDSLKTSRRRFFRQATPPPERPPTSASATIISLYALGRLDVHLSPIWEFNPFVYRMNDANESLGKILQDVCNSRGWKRFGPEEERSVGGSRLNWNLWWRFTPNPMYTGRSLNSWQFTNHIPRAIGFSNKEYLARYLNRMLGLHGSIYDFAPKTFVLPQEYEAFAQEHRARCKLEFSNHENPAERAQNLVPLRNEKLARDHEWKSGKTEDNFVPIWIIKPVGKSQGRGIFVVNNAEELAYMSEKDKDGKFVMPNVVVQEYISRPLLIAGHKFDLRLYVCITSVNPLTVYLYREGLTRFATEKYDLGDLGNCFSHLTNSSVNKSGPNYDKDKEGVGVGCKWSLGQLRTYFKEIGCPDRYLWHRISSLIIMTLIGESEKWLALPYTKNCFTFLGFDVLIDEHLRPWLLEVNLCPGLNADADVDHEIKKPMLHELFDLMGLPKKSKSPENATPKSSKQYVTSEPLFIPKYMPTPLPYMNPDKVDKALELIHPKNRDKFERNPALKNRLANLSSVYSKSLLSNSMKAEMKKKSKATSSMTTSSRSCGSKSNTTSNYGKQYSPTRPQNGLSYRCWQDPVKTCGNWVRIFPFDMSSYEMSRRHKYTPLDVVALSKSVENNLTNARLWEFDRCNKRTTDSKFKEAMKRINKLTTEVWVPPFAKKSEVQDPKAIAVLESMMSASETERAADATPRPMIFTLDSAVSLESLTSSIPEDMPPDELDDTVQPPVEDEQSCGSEAEETDAEENSCELSVRTKNKKNRGVRVLESGAWIETKSTMENLTSWTSAATSPRSENDDEDFAVTDKSSVSRESVDEDSFQMLYRSESVARLDEASEMGATSDDEVLEELHFSSDFGTCKPASLPATSRTDHTNGCPNARAATSKSRSHPSSTKCSEVHLLDLPIPETLQANPVLLEDEDKSHDLPNRLLSPEVVSSAITGTGDDNIERKGKNSSLKSYPTTPRPCGLTFDARMPISARNPSSNLDTWKSKNELSSQNIIGESDQERPLIEWSPETSPNPSSVFDTDPKLEETKEKGGEKEKPGPSQDLEERNNNVESVWTPDSGHVTD